MNENPYMMLAKVILPKEMTVYFDLTKVRTDEYNGEPRIHLYLDEKDKAPDNRTDLSPNGFYEESCMNDFPIREYRTVLHVRRRRWKDADGKSVLLGHADKKGGAVYRYDIASGKVTKEMDVTTGTAYYIVPLDD